MPASDQHRMRGHVLNLDVFNPSSSETHELYFLRSQHTAFTVSFPVPRMPYR